VLKRTLAHLESDGYEPFLLDGEGELELTVGGEERARRAEPPVDAVDWLVLTPALYPNRDVHERCLLLGPSAERPCVKDRVGLGEHEYHAEMCRDVPNIWPKRKVGPSVAEV